MQMILEWIWLICLHWEPSEDPNFWSHWQEGSPVRESCYEEEFIWQCQLGNLLFEHLPHYWKWRRVHKNLWIRHNYSSFAAWIECDPCCFLYCRDHLHRYMQHHVLDTCYTAVWFHLQPSFYGWCQGTSKTGSVHDVQVPVELWRIYKGSLKGNRSLLNAWVEVL